LKSGEEERVDAVVIGTGFGGSVAAWRLAEAGLSVVILERGKLYPPGSFPRSPHLMARNFWRPDRGLFGLFEVLTFKTLGAVLSSGVGGGSLIYANVLLRKDEKWFVRNGADGEDWPVTRADLEVHYDRVQARLKPQKYPFNTAPYSSTGKTQVMQEAAEALNLDWSMPDLGVTFADSGRPPVPGEPISELQPNLHGRTRNTCRLCGECDIGCNYGSKNTTDYMFLSTAVRQGGDLRPLCEVRELIPLPGGGCTVRYVRYHPGLEARESGAGRPLETIEAPLVVLSAGSLGSTSLLLRNKHHFPGISPQLGFRFSGNGDLLAFALRCRINGTKEPRFLDPTFGPVITSTIRIPDELDGIAGAGRGGYIQDGGQPHFASWLLEGANIPRVSINMLSLLWHYIGRRLRLNKDSNFSDEVSRAIGTGALSASTLTLLAMGRDVAGGRITLDEGSLAVEWPRKPSLEYFRKMNRTMADIAHFHGARFVQNLLGYIGRTITVHPLGGCSMGRDADHGVVDAFGQVFGFPGLVIADGSVMPGPVGANPSLTIAALADRFVERSIGTQRRTATRGAAH
jgi:cholesterol oxidase